VANSLGALVVSLGLNAAEFVTGLTKSEAEAKRFARAFDKNVAVAINAATIAITALIAASAVAAVAFQRLVNEAANFKDLEETTGASAESLAALAVSAATAGVEISSVAGSMNKLTKSLVGIDDESKTAGAALKAIGINIKEFKALDPVEQYEAVGRALAGFADGAGKVAVAQALFGKSGAEQLKVFKALEEQGGRQAILTKRQIDLADEYADKQAKSLAQLRLYAQAAATEALPAINDLVVAGTELIKGLIGVDAETGRLAANNGVAEFAERSVDALAILATGLDVFARTFVVTGKTIASVAATTKSFVFDDPKDIINNIRAIGKAYAEDVGATLSRPYLTTLVAQARELRKLAQSQSSVNDKLQQDPRELARRGRLPAASTPDPRPALVFDGALGAAAAAGAASAAAARKKELDNQVRAIRDFADEQKATFEFANQIVRSTYEDGLVDLRGYFAAQQVIRAAALSSQLASIDKEIAALRAAKPKDDAERSELGGKIVQATQRRGEVAVQASRDAALASLDEARALRALQGRYDELRASVLQLAGDSAGAARLRIAKQVEEARALITQQGGDAGLGDQYEAQLRQAQKLADIQTDASFVAKQLSLDEERLAIARSTGAVSELETLSKVGEARRAAVAQMESIVSAQEAIAIASANPALIQNAEEARLALERLRASADPLNQKFQEIFQGSFADAFVDFATGAKSAKDAFASFADDVVKQLIRIAAQRVAEAAFGGASSAGGGYGAFFSAIAGIFGGGKAIGGPTMPNKMYQVGERRPEVFSDGSKQYLLTGSRRGNIDPQPSFSRGGNTVNAPINIMVPGNTDRRSAAQIATEVGRAVSRASSRNN